LNSHPTWLPILLIYTPAFLVGCDLLYLGRRRRVGAEPHCRQCDYLLIGITSERCPECGMARSPANIVYGDRRRRRAAFVTGWLVLGTSVCLGGYSLYSNVQWYEHIPTFLVLRDLQSARLATAQKAWTELMRRDAAGSLSGQTRDVLANFALARQARSLRPANAFDTAVVDYLANQFVAKALAPAQSKAFLDQMMKLSLEVRPKVKAGDDVPYFMSCQWWTSTQLIMTKVAVAGIAVDDKTDPTPASGSVTGRTGGVVDRSAIPASECHALGKHTMGVNMQLSVLTQQPTGGPMAPVYTGVRTVTADFDIEPADSSIIKPVFDPAMAAGVKAAIATSAFAYNRQSRTVGGRINITSAPTDLAFDVFFRYAGSEVRAGSVGFSTKSSSEYADQQSNRLHFQFIAAMPIPPAWVDIVLRPSDSFARQTLDLYSFWNQEVVIPNVPVKQ